MEISVTSAIAFERLVQKCAASPLQVPQIIFATKFLFFVFMSSILKKDYLLCRNKLYKNLQGFLSNNRVSYLLLKPKLSECCCSEELLLNLALLNLNDFCCLNSKHERLSHPCWI